MRFDPCRGLDELPREFGRLVDVEQAVCTTHLAWSPCVTLKIVPTWRRRGMSHCLADELSSPGSRLRHTRVDRCGRLGSLCRLPIRYADRSPHHSACGGGTVMLLRGGEEQYPHARLLACGAACRLLRILMEHTLDSAGPSRPHSSGGREAWDTCLGCTHSSRDGNPAAARGVSGGGVSCSRSFRLVAAVEAGLDAAR